MKPFIDFFDIKVIITGIVLFAFIFYVLRGGELNGEFMTIFAVVVTYWLCDSRKKDGNIF